MPKGELCRRGVFASTGMGEMRGRRRRKRRSTIELEEAKVNWHGCEDFLLLIIVLVKDILSLFSMAKGNGK
jgi:hypothetical protein